MPLLYVHIIKIIKNKRSHLNLHLIKNTDSSDDIPVINGTKLNSPLTKLSCIGDVTYALGLFLSSRTGNQITMAAMGLMMYPSFET